LRAREQLEAERARWSSKLSYLEETVMAGIGKDLGMFTLEVSFNQSECSICVDQSECSIS